MNSFWRIGLSLLLLLPFSGPFAQEALFDLQMINVKDGLPSRRVFNVDQDREGFIWVSTPGAISRYDGYKFRTYNASFLKASEENHVLFAFDKDNNLWYVEWKDLRDAIFSGVIDIGRDTVYDLETFSDGLFTSTDVVHVNRHPGNSKDLFITTRQGVIYKYDGSFEEVYRFPFPLTHHAICEIADEGGHWILYGKEVLRVEDGKEVESFQLDLNNIPGNEPVGFNRIIAQSPRLIVELRKGLENSYWQLQGKQLVPFVPEAYSPGEISGILQWQEDYICFADTEALLIRDHAGKELARFTIFDSSRASDQLLYRTTFRDRQNALWVTTENGLLRIFRRETPFRVFQAGNSIRGIYQDGRRLYIGGYRGNVSIDLPYGKEQALLQSEGVIMSFFKDQRGRLWAGGIGGSLSAFVPIKDQWVTNRLAATPDPYLPFQNPVTRKIWIGTEQGLAWLDEETNEAIQFPLPVTSKNLFIRDFYQNDKGIWIASSNGLFLMDSQTEKIVKHYTTADGLSDDNLNHIHEDAAGIFWLASKGGGLIRWDLEKNEFRQFTQADGLSNNTIYAVYEDEFENLWLPSNYGLMRFDKRSYRVRIFSPQDGLPNEEFNTFAHFQAEDGTLYFGGLNGVIQFHPRDLQRQERYNNPLHLIRVSVLEGNAEALTDKTKLFQSEKIIRLEPGDRLLELEVSLLNYEGSAGNQYAYRIEGFHEQWIPAPENKISINLLPYGRYHIEIRGRGSSGIWSSEVLRIPIHVIRPFYWRWPFILAIAVLVAGAILAMVRMRIVRFKKDRARLEAEVQKRTRQIEEDKQTIAAQAEALKELDRAKSRFFSNITHEFRTPLTLIIGPLEQALAENPPPSIFRRRMQGVIKNARHILGLINQLLDLSKIKSGQIGVAAARGDLVAYTQELVTRFQPLAGKKELRLIFISDQDHWETNFDPDKWDKIVYNLLSNAVKFTPPGKAIQLSLARIEEDGRASIRLDVKDTGMGIDQRQLERVFDRFYQADTSPTRTQGGTGIGLALVKELVELQGGRVSVASQLGKGTSFEVLLPVLAVAKTVPLVHSPAPDIKPGPRAPVSKAAFTPSTPPERKGEKLEVLIIEDNAEMREYIRYCIGEGRYNITEATDGAQGIEKAQALIPDLIISDVMMPNKDGFAVIQAIRGNLGTSHIPLILLTAKASLESRLEGLRRGADAYLTKPFSPQELALRIEKLIELRRMLRQRYQSGASAPAEDAYRQEDEFITELRAYILDHIDEADLSGDYVGRHFGMSRVHLYRKLKALTGQSITEFVKTVRLEKALELIREGKYNVSEVAYRTGFSSVSHFSRSFKKTFGKSPSEV